VDSAHVFRILVVSFCFRGDATLEQLCLLNAGRNETTDSIKHGPISAYLDISVCISVLRVLNENVQCGVTGKGILADARFLYHLTLVKGDHRLKLAIVYGFLIDY
jgi:hypothetical protein